MCGARVCIKPASCTARTPPSVAAADSMLLRLPQSQSIAFCGAVRSTIRRPARRLLACTKLIDLRPALRLNATGRRLLLVTLQCVWRCWQRRLRPCCWSAPPPPQVSAAGRPRPSRAPQTYPTSAARQVCRLLCNVPGVPHHSSQQAQGLSATDVCGWLCLGPVGPEASPATCA